MSEERQANKKISSVRNSEDLQHKISNRVNRDILKRIVVIVSGFAIVALIFGAGIVVGEMKAKFSYRWAENYHKNFGGPRGGFLGDWRRIPLLPNDFIEGHGTFGEIIELNDNSFVIKGRGNVEKIVITTEDTIIKKGMKTIKDGLKVGEYVVVIGSPNKKGQIEAKLIRIFNGRDVKKLRRSSRFLFLFR